jgi:SAM-dependent methyltransferase
MEERKKRVEWIYASRNRNELEERYDQWARDYDSDLDEEFGWVGPQRAVEFLARHVLPSGRILDAGAGTGLVGFFLAKQGYQNLTAMDLSKGMLEEARKKNVYRDFHQMVMGERLDYPDHCFDAVISVGVMTVGHAPASSLDELVRVTRPGGHVVFSLRPDVYRNDGFKEKQESIAGAGRWRLVEVSEEFQPLPKGEPEVLHQVWVYQVSGEAEA